MTDMGDMHHIAEGLLDAKAQAHTVPLLTESEPSFSLSAAYGVADEIRRRRLAAGETTRGYKIGFTNRGIWDRYGVHAPIWGPIWDTTVESVEGGEATVSLAPFVQPRLEPEIMFCFERRPKAGMRENELAECLRWVAHGYEIVHTHFSDWRFKAPDTVADFALHGRLFVGPRIEIGRFSDPAAELASIRVALERDGTTVEEGHASIVLGGPLTALRLWIDAMFSQPERWPIVSGDIVSTGTITDAAPMAPGQRWQTRLSDKRLPGLALVTHP